MKDLKVRVRMVVASEEISSSIAHATARVIKIKEMQKRFMGAYSMNFMQEDTAVYQSEYNRIL